MGTNTEVSENVDMSDSQENNPPPLPMENLPTVHQETEEFDGAWVLANSILFLQDFAWWIFQKVILAGFLRF
jgi:hypothetical protein